MKLSKEPCYDCSLRKNYWIAKTEELESQGKNLVRLNTMMLVLTCVLLRQSFGSGSSNSELMSLI